MGSILARPDARHIGELTVEGFHRCAGEGNHCYTTEPNTKAPIKQWSRQEMKTMVISHPEEPRMYIMLKVVKVCDMSLLASRFPT